MKSIQQLHDFLNMSLSLIETWRDVSEEFWAHENYECSNTGKIRNKKTGIILVESPNGEVGHLSVSLSKGREAQLITFIKSFSIRGFLMPTVFKQLITLIQAEYLIIRY